MPRWTAQTTDDRFDAKVAATPDDCHLWTGAVGGRGYGRIKVEGRVVAAHRYAYERVHGTIPDGMVLDHLCRNRRCVRVDHLEAVSNRDNILRGQGYYAQTHRGERVAGRLVSAP